MRSPLLVAAAATFVVAVLGMLATDIGPWYRELRKPDWQPPDWLFGPAWTLIFTLTAYAAAIGWVDAGEHERRHRLVVLFVLNGFLNVLWSFLFFRLRRPDWALAEVVLLWTSIAALILYTWPFARRASLILVPYLAWVTFAGVLNLAVVRLNPTSP
jgi:translocator protein